MHWRQYWRTPSFRFGGVASTFCFSVSVTRSVACAERRRRCSQRCWYTSPHTNSKKSHIDVELLVTHMNWKEFSLLVRATAGPSAGKGCVLFLHPMRKCGFTVECCGGQPLTPGMPGCQHHRQCAVRCLSRPIVAEYCGGHCLQLPPR